jgi:plasmid stability protein
MCYNCYMAVLSLRQFPDGLMARLKSDAALAGKTLRDHCVEVLSGSGVGQHPERIPASEPGARIATWTEQVSSPASPNKCTQPGHAGFYRSDGYWCATCRKMFVR